LRASPGPLASSEPRRFITGPIGARNETYAIVPAGKTAIASPAINRQEDLMTDKRTTARSLMERMMGSGFADAIESAELAGGFGAPIAGMAMEHAFADVWSRPGLGLRDRSLIVIAILIAQGHPAELKNHIKFGMNNGLTPAEIEEALIQAYPYVGFPATSSALGAAVEALRAMGVDTSTRTAEERGLL